MNWTPLSKKMPKEGDVLIVTIFDTLRQKNELRYPVYYRQSYYSNEYGFYMYGVEGERLLREYSKVLAWMPIPHPWEGEV